MRASWDILNEILLWNAMAWLTLKQDFIFINPQVKNQSGIKYLSLILSPLRFIFRDME